MHIPKVNCCITVIKDPLHAEIDKNINRSAGKVAHFYRSPEIQERKKKDIIYFGIFPHICLNMIKGQPQTLSFVRIPFLLYQFIQFYLHIIF